MKSQKHLIKVFFTCLIIWLSGIKPMYAQLDIAGEIFRAGMDDSNLLFKEYIRPFADGFGADLNSGWFTRARPLPPLGFDLMIRAGVAKVPVAGRRFHVDDVHYNNLRRVSGPEYSPTAMGNNTSGPEMGIFIVHPFTLEQQEVGRFSLPGGTGVPYVPAPIIQAGLGVGVGTEFALRFMPPIRVGAVRVGTNGFGIKHWLNHWFPEGSSIPVDFSIHAGFSHLTSRIRLEVMPEQGNDIYNPYAHTPNTWEGQSVLVEALGVTGNFIAGIDLSLLSFFAGIGFQKSSMDINTYGAYPFTSFNLDYKQGSVNEPNREKIIERIIRPVSLNYDGPGGLHAMGGIGLQLSAFTLSGSFTLSEYAVVNIGIGVTL